MPVYHQPRHVTSERNFPQDPGVDRTPQDTEALSEAALPSADVALVIAFITQLRRVFSAPSYRPPLLPTVALEVHQLSLRSDVGADQLVEVLERDAVLAAQVLRVAGSAAYGGWGQDDISLKGAVVRLGMRSLASVVWEVAAGMRVFRSARCAAAMEQIRTYSTMCAHLCRLVASRKALSPETAFLCGLLHDIGMAATLLVLSDRWVEGLGWGQFDLGRGGFSSGEGKWRLKCLSTDSRARPRRQQGEPHRGDQGHPRSLA